MKLPTVLAILFLFGCDAKAESVLENSPQVIASLESLEARDKFDEDVSSFYPGAPSESQRLKAETILNRAIGSLIKFGKPGPSEEQFWQVMEIAARAYAVMDSEEMDRALSYMEEIMDIYGIQSSGGRLNRWRYGFDPS
ncbi:hypothetical protein RE428_14740 [Marinobacter nanhaiticus D15-8W]|uniref:DUF4844 domain-containing protein n=1 Tax=Marinobacter nanhaiticus D15-8W TaxID=626887 RepID=N6VSF6_9GAMM|nr:DUF4844 domain-containing protein [Marinobacter nanhaiticus]ENO13100.1 DUF4844 domain-containing protein [Marinobacter nanhaiticus D15-8W]BES70456.1 hypothetical protein RE428_14740 [Marinobacter nanhaiticus D15-8W]